MSHRDIFEPTPEPHFIPGYTGHCAHFRFRIGETYGNATHRALLEPAACRERGRLVISDARQVTTERPNPRDVRTVQERSKGKDTVYKHPFVPGYQGFLPRMGGSYGQRFNVAATEAVAEFVECQQGERARRKQLRQEAPGGESSKHGVLERMACGTLYRHPLQEVKPEFRSLQRSKSTSAVSKECPNPRDPSASTAPRDAGKTKGPCCRPIHECTENLPAVRGDECIAQPREEWYKPTQTMEKAPTHRDYESPCPPCPPCEECCIQSEPRQPIHARPPPKNMCKGQRFVLADIRPDIAANLVQDVPCQEPSFLPSDKSTSPYFMEVGNPEKTFKHGYTGHLPFSHSAFGKSHDTQVRSQLAEFTSNYRRRQSQEWAPAEIGRIDAAPMGIAGPSIYPTHVGLLPKYCGHVPGESFRFGKTFGNSTRDAKRWLRGDFS